MSEPSQDIRPPRAALIVVAVGLLACIAAAVLTTGRSGGGAAQLEWVQKAPLPDSKAVAVPGGGDKRVSLSEAGIRATGTNASGFELYRATAVLKIDAGSPVGGARVLCSQRAPSGTEIGQTSGSRASYPRSSPELAEQPVPESVVVEFTSHGDDFAVVELGDAFNSFTSERGIKVEWPTYRIGHERWEWFLPRGAPSKTLALGFGSVWRTKQVPAIQIACTLSTSAGRATVRTAGALPRRSEPIAE